MIMYVTWRVIITKLKTDDMFITENVSNLVFIWKKQIRRFRKHMKTKILRKNEISRGFLDKNKRIFRKNGGFFGKWGFRGFLVNKSGKSRKEPGI